MAELKKDPKHIAWRNKFVEEANEYADKIIGKKRKPEESSDSFAARWNLCYHSQMKTLMEEARKTAKYESGK